MLLGSLLSVNILCLSYMNCKLTYTSQDVNTENVSLSTAGIFQGSR